MGGQIPQEMAKLTIKKKPAAGKAPAAPAAPARREPGPAPRSFAPKAPAAQQEMSFEDKLKQFMADSDSKNSGNRLYAEKRTSTRRRNSK